MQATVRTTMAGDRPEVAAMRETAHRVLGPDDAPETVPPSGAELDALTVALRRHLEALGPGVEQAARRLQENSPARAAALAFAGEVRRKLHSPELVFVTLTGTVMYARRLARVLAALCDHHEILSVGIARTPEQKCPTCRALDDEGANAGLFCEEERRLHERYRTARARAVAARLADRRPAEASE
ncbi:DUF6415 family natural product biosynthesis protein [Streptomyces iakyrus]|uniref:DUF6415 family natural product biosynthesis protein n=1 Tax=Streptomyces iakyrus TaxID=68219 RepID=UPI003D8CA801